MNALTRWDPFREMDELQRRLGSIFGLAPQRALLDARSDRVELPLGRGE